MNTVRGDTIHSNTVIQSNAPGSKLMSLFTPLNTDIQPTVCGTKNYDKINLCEVCVRRKLQSVIILLPGAPYTYVYVVQSSHSTCCSPRSVLRSVLRSSVLKR